MDDLVRAAEGLLPESIALGVADPRDPPYGLWQTETLGPVVPKRLAEFSAGRRAARAALRKLGAPECAIPSSTDRAPVWPRGIVGSISHTDTTCVSIVSKSSQWGGLGVDIEVARPLDGDLVASILVPEDLSSCQNPLLPTLIFAIKEAVYKAQYPITKLLFGFDAIGVSLNSDRFTARFLSTQGHFRTGDQITGRWALAGGHVLAIAAIPP
jgi:4'-phosphopantetheinyl transferase EntD